jgi:sugar lactone lactonase YvrE
MGDLTAGHALVSDIGFLGTGLNRPECVLTHESGYVIAADWTGNGGVSLISPDGAVGRVLAKSQLADGPLRPNGICLEPSGHILAAHLGPEIGGVFRLYPDGELEPVLGDIDGVAVPPSNFPLLDGHGRLWLTVSTRVKPRWNDYRRTAATGFIVMQDGGGARIVADELGYTNECAFSADGRHLYVNETFARRIRRFTVDADGNLHQPTVIATFSKGTFPDGLAMDAQGCLWITSVVSNRIIRVSPAGQSETLFEDVDPGHIDWVEDAFQADRMDRDHLGKVGGRCLRNISSLAFGGPDLKTAYLGNLHDERIATCRSAVAGTEPVHFRYDIRHLISAAR